MTTYRREHRQPRDGEVESYIATHATWAKRYNPKSGKELRFRPCPSCGYDDSTNPAAQINTQTGLWRCFKCGHMGNFLNLTFLFKDPLPSHDRYVDNDIVIPMDIVNQFAKQRRRPVTGNHYNNLLAYCNFRGIDNQTLDDWRVTTKGPKALRFPLFAHLDERWTLVNSRIRVVIDRHTATTTDWFEVKGGPTGLLMGNHLLDLTGPKRAIIFEGQWDSMTAYHLGMRNVFSLPNGAQSVRVSEMLRYIPDDWEIWLGMDMDESGHMGVEKFFAQLGTDRVARLALPYKDINEWYLHKPNLTEKEIVGCLKGLTSQIFMNGKPKGESFLKIDMMGDEETEKKMETVIDTPFEKLTSLLSGGLRGGETTGILAPSGMGKTTMCNQFAVHAALKGIPVGIISLEGTRAAFKRKIKDAIKGNCKPEQYQQVVDNMLISNLEGTKTKWKDCVNEFEDMISKGARLLIWDNLDFISRDNHTDKQQAYGEMIDLSRSYNVHTLMVWQPNKVDRSQVVNSGNQKGFSQTFQDADNYLNLNHVEDFVRLEVEKTRENGVERIDRHVWLIYDRDRRSFVECKDTSRKKYSANGKVVHLHI